ncbi:MAG: hypothetical protein PVH37_15035 [Desulfobacterales bacterium]|jgi:hypothetical protein
MDFNTEYANYLDKEGLKAIQALEKETGKIIMAYPTPPVASNLSDEQLDKIRKLEKKLCVRLVAYETH